MKIKDTFVLRNLAGVDVVIPIGSELVDFNGMITLNETGSFLWKLLEEGKNADELVSAIMNEYEGVEEAEAKADVDAFIETLDKNGIIEK